MSSYTRTEYFTYRCYDADNRCIYVGRTHDPDARQAQHRSATEWWGDVKRVIVTEHLSYREMVDAEHGLIVSLRPAHNRAGVVATTVRPSEYMPSIRSVCRAPGCNSELGINDHYCDEHRIERQRRSNGDDCSEGDRSKRLTVDQIADIKRRMARLENPKDIARSHGITKSSVFRVMKRAS